jgi:hypothetical protein
MAKAKASFTSSTNPMGHKGEAFAIGGIAATLMIWGKYILFKYQYSTIRLHDVTSRRPAIAMVIIVIQ